MSYKKPDVKYVNVKEKPSMASSKRECSERGCCVRSLRVY